MTLNPANTGYLLAIVWKEISSGRACEIIGGLNITVNSKDDYERKLGQMRGLFGEIIKWKSNGETMIATRRMPEWACNILEAHIWEAEEMERWPKYDSE